MKTIRMKRKVNIIPDDIFTYLGCPIVSNYKIPKIELEKQLHLWKCRRPVIIKGREFHTNDVLSLEKHEVAKLLTCETITYCFDYIGSTNVEKHEDPQIGFVKSIRICDYKSNKDYKYAVYITIRIDDEKYPNIYKGLIEGYITDFMFYLTKNNEKYLSFIADAIEDHLLVKEGEISEFI